MSISKIQRDRKIREFITDLVQKGIEPNNYELNSLLREYFDNHIMGMPYYSPIKQKPYEESSKDDYNHNFLTFKEDIETAYEANIETNNKAVSIQEYYDTEKNRVFHAIDRISLRMNCLQDSLKSNKRIQEYVEVFDSMYNLELYGDTSRNIPYTTSFVDLLQKKVVTEKTNSQVNKLSITNATISLANIDDFNGYEADGELEKILNDTINDIYIFTGQSRENTEKSLSVIINLNDFMTFNTVFFRCTSSNDMIFSLSLSEDGDNFYTVYDIKGKDLVEWNFNPKTVKYIKIVCTKKEADGQSINSQNSNIYEYYYIFKNITIALESYESKSVLVTKPIEFNNLTNFIKLDAEDRIFADTNINYFIGFDNSTSKIGWDAIENHKEQSLFMFEKRYNIANQGTYENYGKNNNGELNNLYEVFKIPEGVNINSLKVTPGYNMWAVKMYRRNNDLGDYDDGFSLLSDDVTEFTKDCYITNFFMDCENYSSFAIKSNTLYIFTQYVDCPESTTIYNKYIRLATPNENNDNEVYVDALSTVMKNYTVLNYIRLFVNGYELSSGDNDLYAINLKKGVNKIQIAIYFNMPIVIDRVLDHNLNFKELTNNVFAYKPMKYTNPNMLSKSLEETFEYFTVKDNIVYVNTDPTDLIYTPNNDMGYFISYYCLKDNMKKYYKSNKLKFRLMAILTSKNKNVSPSITNLRITGK